MLSDLREAFGTVQQRLRWNATDIKAGAAWRGLVVIVGPAVNTGSLKPQLSTAYGRDITTWSGADNNNLKVG